MQQDHEDGRIVWIDARCIVAIKIAFQFQCADQNMMDKNLITCSNIHDDISFNLAPISYVLARCRWARQVSAGGHDTHNEWASIDRLCINPALYANKRC